MKISFDNAVGIHAKALMLREVRMRLIAENIANADTPNYKARDLDFKSALLNAQNTSAEALDDFVGYRVPLQPDTGDGNSVDMQVEKMALAENAVGYETALRFVNGKIQGLLKAIRGE